MVLAQTPPPPPPAAPMTADQLVQAAQAAKEAAQAARDAAVATRQAAEALQAAGKPAPSAPPPPAAPPPMAIAPWNYRLALNLISDTGNATAFSGKLGAKVEGHFGNWGLTLVGDAAYGEAEALGSHTFTTTALNADALVRGDNKLSEHFAVYLLGTASTDHVAAINYLVAGEAGISIIWFERKEADYTKVRVRTDVGLRYTHEVDYRFFPTATDTELGYLDRPNGGNIYAPRVAVGFLYAISKTSVFTEDAEVLEDVVDPKDTRFTSVTAISAELAKGFAISLGFKVRYIGVPAQGAVPTDTELSTGLVWTF
jgi:hypothetical protein